MTEYQAEVPSTEELTQTKGYMLLDFGANWCGYCRRAMPLVEQMLADCPNLPHLRLEDGPGRPQGRAFRVKLWPTLILLHDGAEVARVVRPAEESELAPLLERVELGE